MQVKYVVRNLEKVQEYIKGVPRGSVKAALNALQEYFIGTDRHGLRHAPPYKYVSRARAYGQTFKSEKQRRWFWANGGPDMIGNNRTGATENGWYGRETNGGYGVTLGNDAPGAYHTQDDAGQAAQPALVGWRKVAQNVADNMAGALRHAQAAVNAFLRRG
jgi:hypothetical protein